MSCVLVRWAAIFALAAFALPAWACFPVLGAKPQHEISILELPQQLPGMLVAFASEGYVLQAEASDLLTALSDMGGVASPNDLANALRSKMAFGQNIDAQELVAVLISNAAASATRGGRSDPPWLDRVANKELRYAFAKLLQESKVSVTELSSRHVLPRIKLDRFSEICHGGRVFTSLDQQVILHVNDWIS